MFVDMQSLVVCGALRMVGEGLAAIIVDVRPDDDTPILAVKFGFANDHSGSAESLRNGCICDANRDRLRNQRISGTLAV